MTVRKGYILLTDTGTLFTRLIRLYTKKPYNHASIAFDSNLTEVYSFGRKSAGNPFVGGFIKEDVNSELFHHAGCVIYSFTATDEQWQTMNRYLKTIEAQKEDYRYNCLGLIGFIVKRPINRKKAFFCSQFVASILNECNIVDFGKPLSLISPGDLQNLAEFQLIYQGALKGYHEKRHFLASYVTPPILETERHKSRI
ncbi:hypothetical protein SAMN05216238_101227 [Lentibacillus persicus]|uniref:Permuted papain-like amidase enzyme, YaeF/YiiX, C92 family n=1 Tax=Lentibacillus persicus TaxID=640948 RepID=A0A1I1S452_9BACI|nr:hypothetical protein [Lentibacillus persicus]SFD41306.1 hypothetical protein SAMN05216238_101227 [Lentibacillus persicus]